MRRKKIYNMISRMLLLAVLFQCVVLLIPVSYAAETSGACGDGVSWSIDGGVLTIFGNGDMADYDEFDPAPWATYADMITSVRVESGVTSVGDFAFFRLEKLTAAAMADSVTTIGGWAFYGCTAMELLDLGSGLTTIEVSAFEECRALMSVRLPDGLQYIGNQAFYRCRSLKSITIPASVTFMGSEVFTYCTNLSQATVMASVDTLPRWSFYGCSSLSVVVLSPDITEVGQSAFDKCDNLSDGYRVSDTLWDVDVSNSTVTLENGVAVTTDNHYTEKESSSVNVQTTQTLTGNTAETKVEVEAILENQNGWEHLQAQLKEAHYAAKGETVTVNIHLKGDAVISGADLARFAGQNVRVTIHTQQGAYWHINGMDIQADGLRETYDLSYKLVALEDPNDAQLAAVGMGTSFELIFATDIDFKVEIELPLGLSLARETAVFFAPEEESYARKQAVVIDGAGIAHFFLGSVQADTGYLIGINIPNPESNVSDAIIPEELKNEYPEMEQIEEIEYVVTGRKSSWGMDIKQVTWILFGVMGGSILVVGIVIGTMNKVKLKKGYVPDMDDVDHISAPRSKRKKK